MPDVGDVATLTLTIVPTNGPADATTTATITEVKRDGAVALPNPTTTPNVGRDTWTASLPLTAAGEWQIKWTVTGKGAGVQYDTVIALEPPTGRSYATVADLANWLGTEPPNGSRRRLIRASGDLDALLIGAVYTVDTADLPTDATVKAALRDAACAQVEWWNVNGDPDGTGASSDYDDVSIGSVKLSRRGRSSGSSSSGSGDWAPRALRVLAAAGLLTTRVWSYG